MAFLSPSSRALGAVESLQSVDCHFASKIKSFSFPDSSGKSDRTALRRDAFYIATMINILLAKIAELLIPWIFGHLVGLLGRSLLG